MIVELPDELLHRAEKVAMQRKTTLNKLMIEGLEKAIEVPQAVKAEPVQLSPEEAEFFEIDSYGVPVLKRRDVEDCFEICELGCPVLKKERGGVMTNEMVNQMRDELGI
ncbi:hypothetical protein [Haloferula sp. BvORR071]|uniref:hypothetical protein n=1 Tax=Haloferula sp. BvORR071 TaxID=1396141 RepID=UPI000553DC12|nr:hypothetical protein [Haloferula sp. BvORR071]